MSSWLILKLWLGVIVLDFRLTTESKVIYTSIVALNTVLTSIDWNDKYVSIIIGCYLLVFKACNKVVFEKNDKIMRITETMLRWETWCTKNS
jgi:hypothetical protein